MRRVAQIIYQLGFPFSVLDVLRFLLLMHVLLKASKAATRCHLELCSTFLTSLQAQKAVAPRAVRKVCVASAKRSMAVAAAPAASGKNLIVSVLRISAYARY